ncbi:MAG: hypothetical protein LAT82_05670 [Nanoarchaeota archaeon]|nr:hypothetical protein [Nanoarchaeota archaeon]
MITQLEELVFGLETYEKVKIEDRYLEIYSLIQHSKNLEVSNIEEYEILEKCLFKIKELLRVKSSNLNSIIKKKNKLTFEIISTIIQTLELKRKDVLKNAFFSISSINPSNDNILENVSNNNNYNLNGSSTNTTIIPNLQSSPIQEENLEVQEENVNNKNVDNNTILELHNLQFSKVGKVSVKYNYNDLNFQFSKKILDYMFQTSKFQATMLYIHSVINYISNLNSSQHFKNHNLVQEHIGIINSKEIYNPILAPRNEKGEIDNEQVFSQIMGFKSFNDDIKFNSIQESSSKNSLKDEIKEHLHSSKSEYVNINHSIEGINTHRDEEENLEKLISSQTSTHTKHNFKEFEEDTKNHLKINDEIPIEIEVEKNNGIEVEKKSKDELAKELKLSQVVASNLEDDGEKIEVYKEEKHNGGIDNKNNFEDNNNIQKDTKLYNNTFEVETFEENKDILKIFDDEEIMISLLEYSKNIGTLQIDLKNKNPTINSYAHSFLFSKYFLQAIFEAVQPQATMFVTSHYNSNSFLIPRFLEDGVFEFQGSPASNENLDLIQTQIYQTMADELQNLEKIESTSNINSSSNQNLQRSSTDIKEHEILEKKDISSENDLTKKRAKYLLSSLRRYA